MQFVQHYLRPGGCFYLDIVPIIWSTILLLAVLDYRPTRAHCICFLEPVPQWLEALKKLLCVITIWKQVKVYSKWRLGSVRWKHQFLPLYRISRQSHLVHLVNSPHSTTIQFLCQRLKMGPLDDRQYGHG